MSSVDEPTSKRPAPSVRNSLDEPVNGLSTVKRSRTKDQSNIGVLADSSHDASTPTTVNIGTRKSVLARIQTDLVISALQKSWPDIQTEVHAISTMGDKNQTIALPSFDAKSLWTFELEDMLLNGDVDLIVHSLKGAIMTREDPRDALVLHPSLPSNVTLSALPTGSIIGTSSVRRTAQLKRLFPHLKFESVRGNVGTRLRKLDESKIHTDVLGRAHKGHRQGMEADTKLVETRVERQDTAIDENEAAKEEEEKKEKEQVSKGVVHENDKPVEGVTQPASREETDHRGDENEKPKTPDTTKTAKENTQEAEAKPQYSALILAAAGLIRLGLGDRITHHLSAKYTEPAPEPHQPPNGPTAAHPQKDAHTKPQPKPILHAVGQGALGIQIRANDPHITQLLAPLHDKQTELACLAERSLMRFLEGGCSVPIGVETSWSDGSNNTEAADEDPRTTEQRGTSLTLHAVVVSPTPTPLSASEPAAGAVVETHAHVETALTRPVEAEEQAEALGVECAKMLLERGAGDILQDIGRT
ncbi:MAG: hypothetical protein M1831_006270 [Alyxoria varia]|nr:MAG: hypothetical protein M1831_006270 [Alyxoria varia]